MARSYLFDCWPTLLTCALMAQITVTTATTSKRYVAALAKNGRLHPGTKGASPPTWLKKPSDSVEKDSLDPNDALQRKRNVATLARKGWLDTYRSLIGVKRLYGCADGQEVDKRNMAAMARNGRLPPWVLKKSKRCGQKRNIAALARKGFLPQRRNTNALTQVSPRGGVASMARKGLLPSSYPVPRSNLPRQRMVHIQRKFVLPN